MPCWSTLTFPAWCSPTAWCPLGRRSELAGYSSPWCGLSRMVCSALGETALPQRMGWNWSGVPSCLRNVFFYLPWPHLREPSRTGVRPHHLLWIRSSGSWVRVIGMWWSELQIHSSQCSFTSLLWLICCFMNPWKPGSTGILAPHRYAWESSNVFSRNDKTCCDLHWCRGWDLWNPHWFSVKDSGWMGPEGLSLITDKFSYGCFSLLPSHAPARMWWLGFMVGCLAEIFHLHSPILLSM